MLLTWLTLPIELYRQQEASLVKEPSSFVQDFTARAAYRLLRQDL